MAPKEQIEVEAKAGVKFKESSLEPNQMIVVADGDIFTNPISESDGPSIWAAIGIPASHMGTKNF